MRPQPDGICERIVSRQSLPLCRFGSYNRNAGACHIFQQHISDCHRSLCPDLVDLLHTCKNLIFGDVLLCFDRNKSACAAFDLYRRGHNPRRVRYFFPGISISFWACIARYACDCSLIKLHGQRAAHRTADADEFLFLHAVSLLLDFNCNLLHAGFFQQLFLLQHNLFHLARRHHLFLTAHDFFLSEIDVYKTVLIYRSDAETHG